MFKEISRKHGHLEVSRLIIDYLASYFEFELVIAFSMRPTTVPRRIYVPLRPFLSSNFESSRTLLDLELSLNLVGCIKIIESF